MHNTDWNKKLTSTAGYDSSWQWTVDNSEYHFDNTVEDHEGEWYKELGRFPNPERWKDEVARIIELSAPINWATRKFYGDSEEVSPMIEQEERDLISSGADPKLEVTNMLDDFDNFPVLQSLCDYFELADAPNLKDGLKKKYRTHVQFTGQMFNRHIDKLWEWCPEDPERICRIAVFLQDWEPGQFYMYGTKVLTHWKAGEAHIFDWANVPHATANASHNPRVSLLLTGLKSDRTREIIANGNKDTLLRI